MNCRLTRGNARHDWLQRHNRPVALPWTALIGIKRMALGHVILAPTGENSLFRQPAVPTNEFLFILALDRHSPGRSLFWLLRRICGCFIGGSAPASSAEHLPRNSAEEAFLKPCWLRIAFRPGVQTAARPKGPFFGQHAFLASIRTIRVIRRGSARKSSLARPQIRWSVVALELSFPQIRREGVQTDRRGA
jgi:hypothetical protein